MSTTDGRLLRIRGRAVRVRWHIANLESHYQDHPCGGRDAREQECWADLLACVAPATKDSYEEASYDAIEDALVHHRVRKPGESWSEEFVDDRLVKCVTTDDRTVTEVHAKTCFHVHFGGPYNHVVGEHLDERADVRLVRYLDRFEADADMNGWEIRRISLKVKGRVER